MNVLMLNEADGGGGAARAAMRLNRGMRTLGVDAKLLVKTRTCRAPGVVSTNAPAGKRLQGLRVHLDMLPVRCYPNRPLLNFSPAWLPERLAEQVTALRPDLVHLHWLTAGFLRLENLARLPRPLVWTLHDSWAFTGGCHVPFACTRYRQNCGACPVLGSTSDRDLSRRVWERKKRAWENLDLTVVAPSQWLADCARSSSLFHDARVEVIPNGLDLEVFAPLDKVAARSRLGLPKDKRLVLFGGAGIDLQSNKGWPLLKSALRSLAATRCGQETELVVFGMDDPGDRQPPGLPVKYLGWLQDEASLVTAYSAADLFVAPSKLENFPNTVLEAMACGIPCVAFDQGGMSQLIEHRHNGYLATPYQTEDLRKGIRLLLEDDDLRNGMAKSARQKVEENFSIEQVCQTYLTLYRELAG